MVLENEEGIMKGENQYIIHLATQSSNDNFVKNPSVLNDIIGQDDARKKLSFFVASHSPTTPIPTLLFTGSQGLGKSYMANKIAIATGREMVEVNCGTINTSKDFVEKIIFGKVLGNTPKTILLDEAHKLSPEVTTLLLTLLNPNERNVNLVSYSNLLIEYDFRKLNTILATTDAYKIFKPLLNRCVEVYFQLYSNDELYRILEHYLPDITISCDKEDLAYACRGRARDAFILSQNIKRYCLMEGIRTFDEAGWQNIKSIFNIHTYGLNTQEIKLMTEIQNGGPISSGNIAIKMGVSIQNVESELEIRARELGFIENTQRGRILTDKGLAYLSLV